MSDLFQGQTMTEAFRFISGGAAYNLALSFAPDKIKLFNLTDWTSTAAGLPEQYWLRDLTTDAYAFQKQVIDSNAAQSFNYIALTTNGFTDASTTGGSSTKRAAISGITQADPCVVTHGAFTFQTNQIVRITDLGPDMPTARGMDQLNNNRYRITVLSGTTFSLQDPVTGEDIDSTAFTAYVSDGSVTLETTVNQLNNPQVSPYASTPYTPNPFTFDPVSNIMTLGTSVIGGDGDIIFVETMKYGDYTNLGDIG